MLVAETLGLIMELPGYKSVFKTQCHANLHRGNSDYKDNFFPSPPPLPPDGSSKDVSLFLQQVQTATLKKICVIGILLYMDGF